MVQTISGLRLSEATTCLGYMWHCKLGKTPPPALHANETGLRVDRKVHWPQILTNGSLTVQFLYRKRGKQSSRRSASSPAFAAPL